MGVSRTKRSANQKCHAAILRLLQKKGISRKDFISNHELLRVRCRTIDQMDCFPSVLEESIVNEEVQMLAFPAKVKGIKTHVFFVCPTLGNMQKLFHRFEQGFECNMIEPCPRPQEDLDTELKKKTSKCQHCGFKNLEWKPTCFRCSARKPHRPQKNTTALNRRIKKGAHITTLTRPHNIIVSAKQALKKYSFDGYSRSSLL